LIIFHPGISRFETRCCQPFPVYWGQFPTTTGGPMNQTVNQPVNPPAKPDARIHRGPDTDDVWPLIGIMFLHIAIWTGIIIMLALLANPTHAGEDLETDIVIPISHF
jgi:hypothetical protein